VTAGSLLIAGAQKSCSTSLAELLDRHPRVSMAAREVVAFEDPYYPDHLDHVLAHIDSSLAVGAIPGLKRPELLHQAEASARALRHLPDPVVVAVLREPVVRTVSAYHHYVSYGLLPALDPDTGISNILDQMEREESPAIGTQVVTYSLYSAPIRRLKTEIGDRLLVFFQEDLLRDPGACTARILRLLDIDHVDLGPLPQLNVGDYSLRPLKLSRLGGRIGYEVDHAHGTFTVTRHPVRRPIARALFALDRLRPPSPLPRPELSPLVRRRLVDRLADDASRLAEILGEPLPDAWSSASKL
jgi:hypothetical protein